MTTEQKHTCNACDHRGHNMIKVREESCEWSHSHDDPEDVCTVWLCEDCAEAL